MNLIEVVSSNIHSIGYDDNTGILVVKFRGAGGTYEYDRVPKTEYENLLNAESVGGYFSSKIRNKYVTRKVQPLVLVDHLAE